MSLKYKDQSEKNVGSVIPHVQFFASDETSNLYQTLFMNVGVFYSVCAFFSNIKYKSITQYFIFEKEDHYSCPRFAIVPIKQFFSRQFILTLKQWHE